LAQFLTEEWLQALGEALKAHPGFGSVISGVDLTLAFEVSDPPDGLLNQYFMAIDDGTVRVGSGATDSADASVSSNYASASAISKGELNTQMAFMTGKIKISGNMGKLLQHQNIMTEFANAAAAVEVEYA